MRLAAFVIVACASSVAHADLKADVEKLVAANVKATTTDKRADFDRTVTAARVLVLPTGKTAIDNGLVADIYGAKAKKVAAKLENLHVVVDADKKLAWFHAGIAASLVVDGKKTELPMRIAGIAADEGEPLGWKIQAVMYSRTMQDRELSARGIAATRAAAQVAGDAPTAKLVAAWFDGGKMLDDRSKNVAVSVNGTSPLEIGSGAYAVNLVKAWDALKMWATTVESTVFAGGEIAFVRAGVLVPVKEQASAVTLGAILVKENKVWRWVALSLTPADS